MVEKVGDKRGGTAPYLASSIGEFLGIPSSSRGFIPLFTGAVISQPGLLHGRDSGRQAGRRRRPLSFRPATTSLPRN